MNKIEFLNSMNYFILIEDFDSLWKLLENFGMEFVPTMEPNYLLSTKVFIDNASANSLYSQYFYIDYFHYNRHAKGNAGAEEVRKLLLNIISKMQP